MSIERIKEVLDLDSWEKKKKKAFRKRVFSTILAIVLITGAVLFWIYYG
jgi:hypothetical protein